MFRRGVVDGGIFRAVDVVRPDHLHHELDVARANVGLQNANLRGEIGRLVARDGAVVGIVCLVQKRGRGAEVVALLRKQIDPIELGAIVVHAVVELRRQWQPKRVLHRHAVAINADAVAGEHARGGRGNESDEAEERRRD